MRPRRRTRLRATALGATAGAAAAGFGLVARAVARGSVDPMDDTARPRVAAPPGTPARRAAAALGPAGKSWAYGPAAAGVAAYLLRAPGRRDRRPAAAAVLIAAGVATGLAELFDRVLPQPPAPPGKASPRDPTFPSGHALGTGATALTTAYVLAREGLARPGLAAPVAVAIPLVSAGGKLVEEKHWASDVLGGYLAGVAVAAACAAGYELARERRR